MAKRKGQHVSDKECYKRYKLENRHEKNKLRKLRRILKDQPNNKVIEARIKEIEKNGLPYTRNRRPALPGTKRTEWKTYFTNAEQLAKFKKTLMQIPSEVPQHIKVLKELWQSTRPKIRVKRAKRNRVSEAS